MDKVPVIILSSEGSEESMKWGEEAGADAYVQKPFDAKQLQSQASRFLSVAAGRRTLTRPADRRAGCEVYPVSGGISGRTNALQAHVCYFRGES